MKIILVAVLLTLTISYSFDDYIAEFNKIYQSDQQRSERQAIFSQRMAYYEKFNSETKEYTIGPSIWTDRTEDEKKQSLTVKFNKTGISTEIQRASAGLRVGSVTERDWRGRGATDARDQGSCGDCWAFSAIATLESYFLLKNNSRFDLAEQYVLECTLNGSSCSGGQIDSAIRLLIRTGAPLESRYPYLAGNYTGFTFPTTPGICTADSTFKRGYANSSLNTFYYVNKSAMVNLIDQGPISTVIIADSNFQAYRTNVFRCNYSYTDVDINHAVQVVGYNLTGNYFIIKNSWGTRWGMGGFAYVDMDDNCAISRAVYQLVWEWRLVPAVLASVLMLLINI